jgi:hypothetical protein
VSWCQKPAERLGHHGQVGAVADGLGHRVGVLAQPGRVVLAGQVRRHHVVAPLAQLDHHRGPVQGTQLADKPVGACALQQGLLDGGELGVRQPWRRAARPAAAQRLRTAVLPAGMPDAHGLGRDAELAGDLGLAQAAANGWAARTGGSGAGHVLVVPQGGERQLTRSNGKSTTTWDAYRSVPIGPPTRTPMLLAASVPNPGRAAAGIPSTFPPPDARPHGASHPTIAMRTELNLG